MRGIERVSRYL